MNTPDFGTEIFRTAVAAGMIDCLRAQHDLTVVLRHHGRTGYPALALWLEEHGCVGPEFTAAYEAIRESDIVPDICAYLTETVKPASFARTITRKNTRDKTAAVYRDRRAVTTAMLSCIHIDPSDNVTLEYHGVEGPGAIGHWLAENQHNGAGVVRELKEAFTQMRKSK